MKIANSKPKPRRRRAVKRHVDNAVADMEFRETKPVSLEYAKTSADCPDCGATKLTTVMRYIGRVRYCQRCARIRALL